jgi:hypothetical protein
MSKFDSIILNGKSLRPAPFVSTTYEYAKYNNYTIGGLLIVTLSGTLVGEDIIAQITEMNSLQANTDCVSLTIGCADTGGTDFLDGAGRIRSVDVNYDNQPFVASYTMVIEIETIGGQPAVKADDGFATSLGVSPDVVPKFLLDYSENITVDGNADIIGSHDSGMSISKANVKGSGSIRLKVSGRYICGYPSYRPDSDIEKFLKARSQAMINGYGQLNPLVNYRSWNKWLDTKGLEIANNGDVSWRFDLYMIQGGGFTPIALVDASTNDKLDQRTNKRTRSISGSIKGLSLATIGDHIGHKVNTNERLSNADAIFQALDAAYLKYGTWPGANCPILVPEDCPPPPNVCVTTPLPVCYQRSSHSVTRSVINGEISFNMEFLDIDSCKPNDFTLDITIDESFPAKSINEIIIPNRTLKGYHSYPRSIIQTIYTTPRKATITIRATIIGCDQTRFEDMVLTVCCKLSEIVNSEFPSFAGWFYKDQKENIGTYSYSITHERVKCDIII